MLNPGKIICAIRGGESSRRAQERAIELAKERCIPIVFVTIIPETLLKPLAMGEMKWVGETLLRIAVARAQAQQVEATMTVLHGLVAETLEQFVKETQPTILVLGSPGPLAGQPTFSRSSFQSFVSGLQQRYALEVIAV